MLTCVFESLGRAVARHPRLTVIVWAAITVLCGLVALTGLGGGTLFDRLSTGEQVVPGSDSARASALLASDDTGASLSLVVSDVDPSADGIADAIAPARSTVLNIPGVESVIDPYLLPQGVSNPAAAPLLAESGDGFLMVVELDPEHGTDQPHDQEDQPGGRTSGPGATAHPALHRRIVPRVR